MSDGDAKNKIKTSVYRGQTITNKISLAAWGLFFILALRYCSTQG